jgi:hypothetical protein
MWREGRILMVNTTHLAAPAGFHTSQLALHAINRVSDKHGFSYNYLGTGKMNLVNFCIPGETSLHFRVTRVTVISERYPGIDRTGMDMTGMNMTGRTGKPEQDGQTE